jgi:polyvinyl alcohol dehydrogenase (cytochrome)
MPRKMPRLVAAACAAAMAVPYAAMASDWPMFGRTLNNVSSSPDEKVISASNVATLAPKWVATTGGDVSARAAVVNGVAYFPDWGGNIWAVNTQTGAVVWHHLLSDYGLPLGTMSRTSPAVGGNTVYIGTQQGAFMLAINAQTGAVKWRSQMDSHPAAIITAAPAVTDKVIYTGVASTEESLATNPSYACCTFRGSALAVDVQTGKILWKTFTVPTGYSGGPVWGSNAVVDASRGTVFFGTGNNYSIPTDPAYVSCIKAGGTEKSCNSKHDHFDSIMALDMTTGQFKWTRRLSSGDDWNVACASVPGGTDNCPTDPGIDSDFGSAPNEFTFKLPNGSTRTILGAGQKNGIYSAFDPDTGRMLWASKVGPAASLGGIEWGSATDGKQIYVAISNANHLHYAGGTAGSWNALDPLTGAILWRTPDPNGAIDLGPLAVANGIIYAPSMAGEPSQASMFALNANTGTILWSFVSGSSVNAGATIVDGTVFWGSGYHRLGNPAFTGNTKFFAFTPGGQ